MEDEVDSLKVCKMFLISNKLKMMHYKSDISD